MEAFGKLWAIIIGFVIIFICPMTLAGLRQEILLDISILNTAEIFIDKVKYKGYLKENDLTKFYDELSIKGTTINLIHRRRAVRPIFDKDEIIDTREFYIETSFDEIKNALKKSGRYDFKIGDEVYLEIGRKKLFLFPKQVIKLGGLIENEYVN